MVEDAALRVATRDSAEDFRVAECHVHQPCSQGDIEKLYLLSFRRLEPLGVKYSAALLGSRVTDSCNQVIAGGTAKAPANDFI